MKAFFTTLAKLAFGLTLIFLAKLMTPEFIAEAAHQGSELSLHERMNIEFAKQEPSWLDDTTYHTNTFMESDKAIVYTYQLSAQNRDGITDADFLSEDVIHSLNTNVLANACNLEAIQELISKNIVVTYVYTTMTNNVFITEFDITSETCR